MELSVKSIDFFTISLTKISFFFRSNRIEGDSTAVLEDATRTDHARLRRLQICHQPRESEEHLLAMQPIRQVRVSGGRRYFKTRLRRRHHSADPRALAPNGEKRGADI